MPAERKGCVCSLRASPEKLVFHLKALEEGLTYAESSPCLAARAPASIQFSLPSDRGSFPGLGCGLQLPRSAEAAGAPPAAAAAEEAPALGLEGSEDAGEAARRDELRGEREGRKQRGRSPRLSRWWEGGGELVPGPWAGRGRGRGLPGTVGAPRDGGGLGGAARPCRAPQPYRGRPVPPPAGPAGGRRGPAPSNAAGAGRAS